MLLGTLLLVGVFTPTVVKAESTTEQNTIKNPRLETSGLAVADQEGIKNSTEKVEVTINVDTKNMGNGATIGNGAEYYTVTLPENVEFISSNNGSVFNSGTRELKVPFIFKSEPMPGNNWWGRTTIRLRFPRTSDKTYELTDGKVHYSITEANGKSKMIEVPVNTQTIKFLADKRELQQAKIDEENLITSAPQITDDESPTGYSKYKEAKMKADEALKKANSLLADRNATQAAVDQATEELKAVKMPLEMELERIKAKNVIADAVAKQINKIDEIPNLTTEEKAEAKEKINNEANNAIVAINNANSIEAIAAAKDHGKAEIEKISAVAKDKPNAIMIIEQKAKEKEIEINNNASLSDTEKEHAKQEVQKVVEKAKNAINDSVSRDDVNQAKVTGISEINAVNPIGKEKAKEAIDQAVATKEKEINDNASLSEAEKDQAKQVVKAAADKAKQAINDATTQDTVDIAKTTGTTAINAVNPIGKEKANEAIDQAVAAKEKEINDNTSLSDVEKDQAKQVVKAAADKAKQAINDATTQDAVDTAKTTGTTAINAVNPIGKEKANEAIDQAVAAKEKEINDNTSLSDAEKDQAKQVVKAAADKAKQAIKNATTQNAVEDAKIKGITTIKAIKPIGKNLNKKIAINTANGYDNNIITAVVAFILGLLFIKRKRKDK